MKSYLLQGESDIQKMRDLIAHLQYESTVVDFEESIQLDSVKVTTRLWQDNGNLAGFAYLDPYNNLRFEVKDKCRTTALENEIIEWGITCVKKRNTDEGKSNTLDAAFRADHIWQLTLLKRFGFKLEDFRTLRYTRLLSEPIKMMELPTGYSLRRSTGEQEVNALVSLHQAAFGTKNMTVAQRLAIMRAPTYEPELDLVVEAPDGTLVAFCICQLEKESDTFIIGYTDPIGTHPHYQKKGLAKALATVGLYLLKNRGASIAKLSTSSKNLPMQQLAESLGFSCVSEQLWFYKEVT